MTERRREKEKIRLKTHFILKEFTLSQFPCLKKQNDQLRIERKEGWINETGKGGVVIVPTSH